MNQLKRVICGIGSWIFLLALTAPGWAQGFPASLFDAKLSAGAIHSVVVDLDGQAWSWGGNANGQLGDSTTSPRMLPGVVGVGRYNAPLRLVRAITSGGHHSLALHQASLTDPQTVYTDAWGKGASGQLGNLATTDSSVVTVWEYTDYFRLIEYGNIRVISAGANHSLAVTKDGRVMACGLNSAAQPLGVRGAASSALVADYVYDSAAQTSIFIAETVAAGGTHSLALKGGVVYAWGSNLAGQLGKGVNGGTLQVPTPVVGLPAGIIAIAAGDQHSMALDANRQVWIWGSNTYGQIGKGLASAVGVPIPTLIPSSYFPSPIRAIAAGAQFSLALAQDGSVYTWGRNHEGQLGYPTTTTAPLSSQLLPRQIVGFGGVESLGCGPAANHVLSVKSDGSVWAWGWNANGQLGSGILEATARAKAPAAVVGLNLLESVPEVRIKSPVNGAPSSAPAAISIDVIAIDKTGIQRVEFYADGVLVGTDTAIPFSFIWQGAPAGIHQLQVFAYNTRGVVTGSQVVSVNVQPTAGNKVAEPVVSIPSGTYLSSQDVTVTCATPEAVVHYTTNGNVPSELDPVFAPGSPIWVNRSMSLKLRAFRVQYAPSEVKTFYYQIAGAISARLNYSLALSFDSRIWGWGDNATYQLGIGTKVDSKTPKRIEWLGFSTDHSYLGDLSLGRLVALSAGETHALALNSVGDVFGWGDGEGLSQPNGAPVGLYTGYGYNTAYSQIRVAIAAGGRFSLVLTSAGTVIGRGLNTSGQLGDGSTVAREFAPAQGLGGIIAISAGHAHALALRADGSVWAWGENAYGQVGNGKIVDQLLPTRLTVLDGLDVVAVVAGDHDSFAILRNGKVYGWGLNTSRQLGNGRAINVLTPELNLTLAGVSSIAAAATHTVACTTAGLVYAWGTNLYGELGDGGSTTPVAVPKQIVSISKAMAVAAGTNHTLISLVDGSVYACGLNSQGQLGDNSLTVRKLPVLTSGIRLNGYFDIDGGDFHSVAVDDAGTLWTWGQNTYGQLGNGTTDSVYAPVAVSGLDHILSASAGAAHTLALTSDGTVFSWGRNLYGELGDGLQTQRKAPFEIPGLEDIIQVVAGGQFSLALDAGGTLWQWGRTPTSVHGGGGVPISYGYTDLLIPTRAGRAHTNSALSAGRAHYIQLDSGRAVTGGENLFGQLGLGSAFNYFFGDGLLPQGPANWDTLGFTAAVAGTDHNLVLRADGTVWAWGRNDKGQVGNNALESSLGPVSAPVQVKSSITTAPLNGAQTTVVPLTGVVEIGTASDTSFALKSDGTLWAWGENYTSDPSKRKFGSNFTIAKSHAAIKVASGLGDMRQITGGNGHVLGLRIDGTVLSWGDNAYGALGDLNAGPARPLPALIPQFDLLFGQNAPVQLDSDGDGFTDNVEALVGTDPFNASSAPVYYVNPVGSGSGGIGSGGTGGSSGGPSSSGLQVLDMKVTLQDIHLDDDVWYVYMQIVKPGGALGPKKLVIANTNPTVPQVENVQVPVGMTFQFIIERREVGQKHGTDEYALTFELVNPPKGVNLYHEKENTPNFSLLSQTLSYPGTSGQVPPDTSALKWQFTVTPIGDAFTVPFDDASGARYRKLALNGRPLPDGKPQAKEETDQHAEETFIDALTLGLRHSVSYIYSPVAGSDLTVGVRRNIHSEVWNMYSGLRPQNQLFQPFGTCWDSNISAHVEVVQSSGQSTYALVTDEGGGVHRFVYIGALDTYVPVPTSQHDQSEYLNYFAINGIDNSATFIGKYGTKISFVYLTSKSVTSQLLESPEVHFFMRPVTVTDRIGNILDYTYPTAQSAVPSVISLRANPAQAVYITSNADGLVTDIGDANGNHHKYAYTQIPYTTAVGNFVENVLTTVTAPDISVATPNTAATAYGYEIKTETDQTPAEGPNPIAVHKIHCDLISIKDPQLNVYQFQYGVGTNLFDQTRSDYSSKFGYYKQTGARRCLKKVILPDGSSALFDNQSDVRLVYRQNPQSFNPQSFVPTLDGNRRNVVTDAENHKTTYDFTNCVGYALNQLSLTAKSGFATPVILYYTQMSVSFDGVGVESFQFDPYVGLALKGVIDLSGNYTSYSYADALTLNPLYSALFSLTGNNGQFDDPTQETRTLTSATQPTAAIVKQFKYSGPYRLLAESKDAKGNVSSSGFDALWRRTSASSGNGLEATEYVYQSALFPGVVTKNIRKASILDPAWATDLVTDYTLDGFGRVTKEILGGVTHSSTYDAQGNKLRAADGLNNLTSFVYDTRYHLVEVDYPFDPVVDGVAPAGHTSPVYKTYTYDLSGNKTAETDERRVATTFAYDKLNRLTAVTAPTAAGNAVTKFGYDKVNNKNLTTDPRGTQTSTHFDAIQRPDLITVASNRLGEERATSLQYGTNSGGSAFDVSAFKPTVAVDPRGITTTVTYDSLYRPVIKSVAYETGKTAVSKMVYDPVGNLLQSVDPLNFVTTTTYDAVNRPLSVIFADTRSRTSEYTGTGLTWRVTDELGRQTETRYDTAGRPVMTLLPKLLDGQQPIIQKAYDAASNLSTQTDPLNRVTSFFYDQRNRKIREVAPDTATSKWVYDAVSNVVATIDPLNNRTDNVFDQAHRMTTSTGPALPIFAGVGLPAIQTRPVVTSSYDLNGNLLSIKDPRGNLTSNVYDWNNQLLSSTDPQLIVVSYAYDKVGNRTMVTDGKLQPTTFTYDGLNRLLKTTHASGAFTSFLYDAVNKTTRFSENNEETAYSYDSRHRPTVVTRKVAVLPYETVNYGYDAVGNLLSVTEPTKGAAATVAFTYDALNRVTTETSSSLTHTYIYDLVGNRTRVVYGGTGRVVDSTYDSRNRLLTMKDLASVTAPDSSARATGYIYDLNGNVTSKSLPNGDVVSTTYDPAHRAKIIEGTRSRSLLYRYTQNHDLLGNVLRIDEVYPTGLNNRVLELTYDGDNRLTQEKETQGANPPLITGYTYDSANNRLTLASSLPTPNTSTYVYNSLNQLTEVTRGVDGKKITFTYDLKGNRSTRTLDAITDNYSFDFENRLVQLQQGGVIYKYTYDYRTRRVVRNENSQITQVAFSGGTSYQESTNGVTVEFIRGSDYGGGVGGILYSLRAGVPSFTHYDGRGDVTAKTDGAGALTYQAAYTAFGKRNQEVGATQDRQKANTKEEDPSGLLNEGFRYRDLETGTFLTRDPAGFVDGPNLYAYVRQNPWTSFDPEGLASAESYKRMEETDQMAEKLVEQRKSAADKTEATFNQAKADYKAGKITRDQRFSITSSARREFLKKNEELRAEFNNLWTSFFKGERQRGEIGELTMDRSLLELVHNSEGRFGSAPGKDIDESIRYGANNPVAAAALAAGLAPSGGTLTAAERAELQAIADKHGTTIDVVGSRAAGKGRNIDHPELPVGKGPGTRSDIDTRIDTSHPQAADIINDVNGVSGGAGNASMIHSTADRPTFPPFIRIEPTKP